MKTTSKHRMIHLSLASIIVLVLLTVFFAVKSPANEVQNIGTSTWEEYRNENYGFEMEHPKGWHIEDLQQGIRLKSSYSDSKFEILQAENEKSLTLENWFRDFTIIGGRPTAKAGGKLVTLNGQQAYKLASGLEPPNPLFEAYLSDDQRNIFVLSATSANTNDSAILNTILSTFQFISR